MRTDTDAGIFRFSKALAKGREPRLLIQQLVNSRSHLARRLPDEGQRPRSASGHVTRR